MTDHVTFVPIENSVYGMDLFFNSVLLIKISLVF